MKTNKSTAGQVKQVAPFGRKEPDAIKGTDTDVPPSHNASLPGAPKHLGGFEVSQTPGRIDQ